MVSISFSLYSCLSCVSVDKCNTNISLFYEPREHNSCDIQEWNFTCHIDAAVNLLITAIKQHAGGSACLLGRASALASVAYLFICSDPLENRMLLLFVV